MPPLFVANWKMHGSLAFLREWTAAVSPHPDADIVVCPPLPYLSPLAALLPAAYQLGAQTVSAAADAEGAHTGEVSAQMLADIGCCLAIIGHSERRARQYEDDACCAAKIRAAAAAGIRPLLCVGESAAVRASGDSEAAVAAVLAQVSAGVTQADDSVWRQLIIAYEPVWAIGSGKTPAPDDITRVQSAIRECLIQQNPSFGGKIPLLYGGSVKAANAKSFITLAEVNGFLVGGAALSPVEFSAICNSHHTP